MKWINRMFFAVALSLFAGNMVMAEVDIERPAVLNGALLTVTVSDLHGLIDGVGSVASQISPMMNGTMLKNVIGMQLGDPQLAGISSNKGLVVVALDASNVFAMIEVDAAQFSAYTNALSPSGMQSMYRNGFLIVGQTADQVAQGADYAEAAKNTLLAKRSPTLRIAMKPSESLVKNNDQIQGMLAMMPMMMGMGMQQNPGTTPEAIQGLARMLEGEVRILLSMAQQVEAAEVTVIPTNGSIRIEKVLSPVAGSHLATLCNSPTENQWNSKLHSGVLGEGAIQLDFCIANPEALAIFVTAEAEQLIKEMELGEAPLVKSYVELMQKWAKAFGGTGCEVVQFGGGSGFGVAYLVEIKDEPAVLEMLKTMQASTAGFLKLYEDMGMPMAFEFKENEREHVGVKIHQLKMSMSLEQMPAEQQGQFNAMGLSNMLYEIAIADGVMACSMGEGKIEKLIDQLKDAKESTSILKARSVYPAGAEFYCDYNIGQYLDFVAELIPETPSNPLSQIAAMLADAEPVTLAGYRNNGRLKWGVNVPGDLLVKVGQVIMMQQAKPQNTAPAGMSQP